MNVSSDQTTDIYPKISIITVVFNSEKYIEKTIQSIINQTYTNIEYLIIDGGSKDKTLSIIEKYKKNIQVLISSPDKGLYDAMNKGLKLATGDFIWFINSGDQIFSNETLSKIFCDQNKNEEFKVYYGETEIIDNNGDTIGGRRLQTPEILTWKSFQNGMVVCHQSIIINRLLIENYDLKYRHSADYEWVLKALKKTDKIKNTHLILSKFMDGGQSKQNIIAGLKERYSIMCQHYGYITTLWKHVFIGIKFALYVMQHKRF